MTHVHTQYGPGTIVASETVRGQRRFKVAGEGFEVWLDETKLGAYERPADIDFDAPHWEGHNLDDGVVYPEPSAPIGDDEYAEYADPRGLHDRSRMRTHPDYLSDDDPDTRYANRRQGGYADEELRGLTSGDLEGYDPEYDPRAEYRGLERDPGLGYDDDPDSRYARRQRSAGAELGGGDIWHDYGNEFGPYDEDPYADVDVDVDPRELRHLRRERMEEYPDDFPEHYSSVRRQAGPHGDWAERILHEVGEDDPHSQYGFDPSGGYEGLVEDPGLGYDDDPDSRYARRSPGKGNAHLGWAPLDDDNSTELPYNPDPQHEAVGTPGDDDSSTLQPIHHIDAEERTHPADSLSFEEEGGGDGPGPNPDLFAKSAGSIHEAVPVGLALPVIKKLKNHIGPEEMAQFWSGQQIGQGVADTVNSTVDRIDKALEPGPGWGPLIHGAGLDRPSGLGDRYIDLTASADYHNDPAAQFRHDPDAYINRIGHLMDEGLNPRFAEYMDLVEGDASVRTAAWKDVRKKAMRLKTTGKVHVKDLAPSSILASVEGDHGTYDVAILKGASYGDQSIANWHCACEWGRWAFRRKFSYVGRLCSHAYASYLTMQSAALKEQRPTRRNPSDMVIKRRNPGDRAYPMPVFAAGLKTADALQNGPERLTPELVVNDTDDAHTFLDVTKDERKDTGPDDVVSDKDIVHFARLMRHCEVTQQPYPRQLVAFLARYAKEDDDTPADYQAADADDAKAALSALRSDADRDQEGDFGSMAERVHKIQDAVEQARDNGADASRFVAMVKQADSTSNSGNGDAYPSAYGDAKSNSNQADPSLDSFRGILDQLNPFSSDYFRRSGPGGPLGQSSPATGTLPTPGKGQETPAGASREKRGLPPVATPSDPESSKNGVPTQTKAQPSAPANAPTPVPATSSSPSSRGGESGYANGKGDATSSSGGGKYTAPGGGQTSGTVADGGVAGAENGNNSAITKNSPGVDANGIYTVQKGDTWTDIAQRATGDMNNYQKMYDAQGGKAGGNIDDLAEGTQVNLKDFLNDKGNGSISGDKTNPADGGSDKNIATPETPKADTSAASGKADTPATPAGGDAASTSAVPKVDTSGMGANTSQVNAQGMPTSVDPGLTPAAPNAGKPQSSLRTAKEWLRWAADGDSSSSSSSSPSTAGTGSDSPPATNPATSTGTGTRGKVTPDTGIYDPNQLTPSTGPGTANGTGIGATAPATSANGGQPGGGSMGTNISDIGSQVGNAVGQFLPGVGGAISGIATGIGGLVNTFSNVGNGLGGGGARSASLFASKEDFDDWVRYAYPEAGKGEHDLPHLPFAGSGNPGPLEFTTSEEYADKARRKHDDVTDLGSGDLTKPMGEWQKQSYRYAADDSDDDDDRPRRKPKTTPWGERVCEDCGGIGPGSCVCDISKKQSSIGYSTDDDSDVVRTFQAHLGDTALGSGAGGGGRFDDIAGAAQGFLRTAGRNYSLSEQEALIREGDKGGARNLDSLDLQGTHYEDMHTLGW